MWLFKVYSNKIRGLLRHHYGADEYELARVEHGVMCQHLGVVVCVAFAVLAWQFMPRPFFHIAGVFIGGISAVFSLLSTILSCSGRRDVAIHVSMVLTVGVILGGVYISGGFPYSIATFMTVLIPILMLRLYSIRAGIVGSVLIPAIGITEWYLEHQLGLIPTMHPYVGEPATAHFSIWIIGHSLILLYFIMAYKENGRLQAMLLAERERYAELAVTDNLTQLFNGRKFLSELEALIGKSQEEDQFFHLAFIDLNRFKYVNDTYGHDAGDTVLQIAAQRLQKCIRAVDLVARLGGDEFAVIFRDNLPSDQVEDILMRIRQSLEEPIAFGDITLHISASIGLARFPDDSASRDALMKLADSRMYADKTQNQKLRA
ncbi:MAG: GGDEF domain-containing protein [Hyphomonadaceae bacterium]